MTSKLNNNIIKNNNIINNNYINNNIKNNNTNFLLTIFIIKNDSNELLLKNYDKRLNIIIINNDINKYISDNKSRYYTIIFDNYIFKDNFFINLLNYLENLINVNILVLINDYLKDNNDENFYITPELFKRNYNNHISIFNSNIKKKFNYSITDIGLFLYNYSIINNYTQILATTNHKFNFINENKQYIKDILLLFDIYIYDINNNLNEIDEDIINIPLIEL
jgi:hypothetical protein